MGISFDHPWTLVLAPLLILMIYYHWRRMRLRPANPRLSISVRLAVSMLLVLALAGTSWYYQVQRQAVVFLADSSDSVLAQKEVVERYIVEALAQKDAADQAAVVAFGSNALVEIPMMDEPPFEKIESLPKGSFTNIAEALRLAGAMLPSGYRKRVVVVTDGKETMGDALTTAAVLNKRDIRVDVVPVSSPSGQEVRVAQVSAPAEVRKGEAVSLEVTVDSTYLTRGELYIYRDRTLIGRQELALEPGPNKFLFTEAAGGTGFHRYAVEAKVLGDTESRNNQGYALTHVTGAPRVLLVSRQENPALARALSGQQFQVEVTNPVMVPRTETELGQFDTIILDNVPAYELPQRFLQAVETCVKELGTGLLMTGGEDSLGLGGYYRTPVEDALPVHMDLRGKKELPSLGLMLVLDKSGSMSAVEAGFSKIDLAKEAAIRSTEILMPKDQVGVLAFDGVVYEVAELGPATDLRRVQRNIASIAAGGGTDIYPALETAVRRLEQADTTLKHIILLTDGQSGSGGSYRQLVEEMGELNITLTTVAVGSGADTQLLSTLAKWGKGRYYYTDSPASIPKIFTKETMLVSRSYLVKGEFIPRITGVSSIISGLKQLPALQGYVAAAPKQAAKTVLGSNRQDPILATWQYGLGRSAVWTSDTAGLWSGDWLSWSEYAPFFARLVSWTLPQERQDDLLVQAEAGTNSGRLVVDMPHRLLGSSHLSAKVIGPEGSGREVELEQVGPGLYETEFPLEQQGVYLINILEQDEEGFKPVYLTGLAVPYSPEYAQDTPEIISRLAEAGGGEVLQTPAQSFADNLPVTHGRIPLWPWLLAAAALLWPLDIAVRRFVWPKGWLGRLLTVKQNAQKQEEAPASTFSRLAEEKGRRRILDSQWDDAAPKPPEPASMHPKKEAETKPVQKQKQKLPASDYTARLLQAKKRAQAEREDALKNRDR